MLRKPSLSGGRRSFDRPLSFLFLSFLILLLSVSQSAQAEPQYTITDLGTLPGTNSIYVYGMNNAGQVVGWAAGGNRRAFLWQEGVMTDLGTLGGNSSQASDINSKGQVAGVATTSTGRRKIFLWLPDPDYGLPAGMNDLGIPGGDLLVGINDLGQVVSRKVDGTLPEQAFLWLPAPAYNMSAGVHELGALGGPFSHGYRINNNGQVVGNAETPDRYSHAFLWQNGVMESLPELPGYHYHAARDINEAGEIVGYAWRQFGGNGERAVLWRNGEVIDLGSLGGAITEASSINERSQIVGLSQTASGVLHAVIWEDGLIQDLNDLIPVNSGWDYLNSASVINDSGQIAGAGYLNGRIRGFLLTPIVANRPPDALDDTATTKEDTSIDIPVLTNDSDPDGDPLIVTGVTQGASGSVEINADSTVKYTPNQSFNCTDSFDYTVSDGHDGNDAATVRVTVNPKPSGKPRITMAATLIRDGQELVVSAVFTNRGGDAEDVRVTRSLLGTASTTAVLPLSLGSLAGGDSAQVTLRFPGSAGDPGAATVLWGWGTFTGGSFSCGQKVTLP